MGELIFGKTMRVERNGKVKEINIPEDFIGKLVENRNGLLVYPRVPFIVRDVPDSSVNAHSGLMPKDQVIIIDGVPVKYLDQAAPILDTLKGRNIRD